MIRSRDPEDKRGQQEAGFIVGSSTTAAVGEQASLPPRSFEKTCSTCQNTIELATSLVPHYELGRTIGRGEFAKVKIARCLQTGEMVAIKIIRLEGADAERRSMRLNREISILAKLCHPNIVGLRRVFRLPDRLAIVLDYAGGGELFDYVQGRGFLPNLEIKSFMKQIFQAVDYLHQQGFVHRDLKLENVLLSGNGRVLLTDFGFAAMTRPSAADKEALLRSACGSPCYAAPELVLHKRGYRGAPVDIWSCGVIMYAMAFGHLPFEEEVDLGRGDSLRANPEPIAWTPKNVYKLYQFIAGNPLVLPRIASPDGLDILGQALLLRLLEADPTKRISMSEIWTHPYFQ